MIRSRGFPPLLSALHLLRQDGPLKAHFACKQAKAGDKDAALELVIDLVASWLGEQNGRFKPGLLYVAPHAQEASGDSAIPQTELSNYIQVCGGVVRDVVVLVNAGRNLALVPEKKFVQLIKERFDEEFTEIFGIEPVALTANEAQYLVGFKSADGIRDRLATAEQEIDRRLRSKGIIRTPETASLGASTDQGLNSATPEGAT